MGGFKLHGYCKGESTANVRAGIVGLHTSNRTRKGDSEEDIINAGFYQTFPGAITRTMEVEVSCHNASVYDLEDLSDHRQLYPTRSRKSDESLAGLKKHTQFG